MELISNREKRPLSSLHAVFAAVVGCVEGAKQAVYDFELDDIVLDFQGGDRIPFGFLSDGQRSMTALAADIAVRCVQLNPFLKGDAPKITNGVVLIDELDLHLHPNWQRTVISDLTTLFPKLQFVVTTHSPFIVQSLDNQGLVNLSDSGTLEKRKEHLSVEDIAEETMGVDNPQRSKQFQLKEDAARQYYELLDRLNDDSHADVMQAKGKLDEIEARFVDDPAYVAFLKIQRSAAREL